MKGEEQRARKMRVRSIVSFCRKIVTKSQRTSNAASGSHDAVQQSTRRRKVHNDGRKQREKTLELEQQPQHQVSEPQPQPPLPQQLPPIIPQQEPQPQLQRQPPSQVHDDRRKQREMLELEEQQQPQPQASQPKPPQPPPLPQQLPPPLPQQQPQHVFQRQSPSQHPLQDSIPGNKVRHPGPILVFDGIVINNA